MTCVAYRDGVLAADKKSTYYGGGVTTTKIRRMGDGSIAGCSGQGGMCRELLLWYEEGAMQDYPDRAGTALMLVIDQERVIRLFDGSGVPVVIEDPYFAVGSGKDAALAAMYLGFDARRAVEVACAIDDGCGRGIDALEIQA